MDVSDLVTEFTKPWEVSENPATKFARDDKYEHQLLKAGLPDQQALWLSHAQAVFKATGEYDAQLREFDTHPIVDHMFPNFRTFIVTKFTKHKKGNRSIAKGIANAAEEAKRTAEEQAEETAWAMAELANAITTANKKDFEQLTSMFSQLMQKLGAEPPQNSGGGGSNNRNKGTTAAQGTGGTGKLPMIPCIHCECKHGRPDAQCWELEANAASSQHLGSPLLNAELQGIPSDGVGDSKSQLRSGSQVQWTLIK